MDLSFARNASLRPVSSPGAMTALLAGAGARQAASATARVARNLADRRAANPLMTGESGAFSIATAAALTMWKQL